MMATAAANPRGVVGPNAVIQMAAALIAHGGPEEARRVFAAADLLPLLADPPDRMVDQSTAGRLHDALRHAVDTREAERIAYDAGARTAEYLLAHRIPRVAQWAMRHLPRRMAASMLLQSMRRNAWTFAGTGAVRIETGASPALEIVNNPLAQPGCPWHRGVLERLFQRLIAPGARVAHHCCCTKGGDICRFDIVV